MNRNLATPSWGRLAMRVCTGLLVLMTMTVPAMAQAPAEEQPPWLTVNVNGHTADVRALAFTPDSKRLCSAGLDKVVKVWNTGAIVRDLKRTWLLERSIRWQVGRGLRGSIYALSTAPNDGLLAVAGYGATGALGEILLVDPVQGSQERVLTGHKQTVCSLAFSADGQWLASLDVSGRLIFWNRGDWKPITVYDSDTVVYGKAKATLIEQQPNLRPIAMVGSSHVVIPVFVGAAADGRPTWRLQQIGLADRKDVRTFDAIHQGMVTALAVSADGGTLASGDLAGSAFVGRRGERADRIDPEGVPLSMCFNPAGDALVIGTGITPAFSKGQLEVWDVGTRTLQRKRLLPGNVSACAVSPDGKMLASTGGEHHAIFLGTFSDLSAAVSLRGSARRVVSVAFARGEPRYRVAFGTTFEPGTFNQYGPLEQTFDAQALEFSAAPPNPAEWTTVAASQGRWRAEPLGDGSLQLLRDGVPTSTIRLDRRREGAVRSYCWIGPIDGEPTAIAVGTDIQNSIYVYQLVERGPSPLLRHFRGHNDFVTSLSVSADQKYLASGSDDGTVRLWSLSGLAQGRVPRGRWGVQLAVQGNQLVVTDLDPAGPFYFKGVRAGDVITTIRWPGGAAVQTEQRSDAMLARLSDLPWETQVVFEYARGGAAQTPFQLLPAWQPMANLFVTSDREWAFWTPEGYYDASNNGHTLFGWLVNRGLESLPEFFRADQFRKKLERPDVLEKLLPSGNLDAALKQAAIEPPKHGDEVVEKQIAQAPRINIVTPKSGASIAQSSATVRVSIRVPQVSKLARVKLFANGVVAPDRKLIEERPAADGQTVTYEWNANLPSEQRNLIQVFASTDSDVVSFNHAVIERGVIQPAKTLPKLYVLAVGIDTYRDPSIQPLAWSVADAKSIVQLLETRAKGLYTIEQQTVLLNEQVTRDGWTKAFDALSTKLKSTATPDDLLVIFMAGHGFVDPATQRYYYAGHDLTRDQFMAGDYSTSISWSDFELLSDIPCRKLALLDTCHSGAIQPLRSRNLKSAIRDFQEDVVFTLTASAGNERSEENADWGHGAFTKSLLEALSGKAATSTPGVVMFNDVVGYVQQSVPALTDGRQNPTVAPEDLLPYVSLRLASVDQTASTPLPASHAAATPAHFSALSNDPVEKN